MCELYSSIIQYKCITYFIFLSQTDDDQIWFKQYTRSCWVESRHGNGSQQSFMSTREVNIILSIIGGIYVRIYPVAKN